MKFSSILVLTIGLCQTSFAEEHYGRTSKCVDLKIRDAAQDCERYGFTEIVKNVFGKEEDYNKNNVISQTREALKKMESVEKQQDSIYHCVIGLRNTLYESACQPEAGLSDFRNLRDVEIDLLDSGLFSSPSFGRKFDPTRASGG